MGSASAYRLGPESGRLVQTTRTGLGAKAGHDLTIEVTRWHGGATVDAATPANSSVAVEVEVDSFEGFGGLGLTLVVGLIRHRAARGDPGPDFCPSGPDAFGALAGP